VSKPFLLFLGSFTRLRPRRSRAGAKTFDGKTTTTSCPSRDTYQSRQSTIRDQNSTRVALDHQGQQEHSHQLKRWVFQNDTRTRQIEPIEYRHKLVIAWGIPWLVKKMQAEDIEKSERRNPTIQRPHTTDNTIESSITAAFFLFFFHTEIV